MQKRANRANQLVLFFLAGANFWEKHAKNRRKQAKTRENRRKTGAFLVLIFLWEKLVGANFYAFCNYDFHLSLFLKELVNISFLVTYITGGIRSIRVTSLLLHSFVWVAVAVTVLKESLVPRGQTNPRKNIAILISFPFSLIVLRTILGTNPRKKDCNPHLLTPFETNLRKKHCIPNCNEDFLSLFFGD